jgi:hypothetical protein
VRSCRTQEASLVLIPDRLHKLLFFSSGHIQYSAVAHYYLAAFAADIFFSKVFMNDIGVEEDG